MKKAEQLKHLRKCLEQMKFFDSMYPNSVDIKDFQALELAIKGLHEKV